MSEQLMKKVKSLYRKPPTEDKEASSFGYEADDEFDGTYEQANRKRKNPELGYEADEDEDFNSNKRRKVYYEEKMGGPIAKSSRGVSNNSNNNSKDSPKSSYGRGNYTTYHSPSQSPSAAKLTRTALREAQTLAIALREVQVATVLQALDIVRQILAIVGPVLVRQVPDIPQQVQPIALREAQDIVRQVLTTALREVP